MAIKEGLLWFVEVKGSSSDHIDYEIVDAKKQRRLRKSIVHWLTENEQDFDEMEIVVCFRSSEGMDWITGAFE